MSSPVVKRPRGRPRKLAPGPIDPVVRLANAVERLALLYEMDLASRGLTLNPPDSGEGEVLVTDDAEVAARIERIKQAGIPGQPGFFVGDEPQGILDAQGRPRGEEVAVNYDPAGRFGALFGGGWGFNVGPEGAEEDRSGPNGDRSSRSEDPGPVRGPGDSQKPEGESGADSGEKSGGNS